MTLPLCSYQNINHPVLNIAELNKYCASLPETKFVMQQELSQSPKMGSVSLKQGIEQRDFSNQQL